MKVQEIANQLNIDNRELITFLFQNGIRVKTPSHKLDPGTSTKIIRLYKEKKRRQEQEDKPLPEKNITIPYLY